VEIASFEMDYPVTFMKPEPNILNIINRGFYPVFIAQGNVEIISLDVRDPGSPRLINVYTPLSVAPDITIINNYVYFADYFVHVYEISDPNNWIELGYYYDIENTYCIESSRNKLLILSRLSKESSRFTIFDTNNPVQLQELGSLTFDFPVCDRIFVNDKFAIIIDYNTGDLHIINIEDYTNPHDIGQYELTGFTADIELVGNYLFISSLEDGLKIIDLTNPVQPEEIGLYNTSGYIYGVDSNLHYACLAARYYLDVLDISQITGFDSPAIPISFILYDPYPNPFNSNLVMPFELFSTGIVNLNIYDINGRSVYATSAMFADGYNRFVINNTVIGLANGQYYFEIAKGNSKQVRKAICLK